MIGEVKGRSLKTRSGWVTMWLGWAVSTTLGWILAGLLTLGMAFAYAIPDPDAARSYLSTPLRARLLDGLLLGAMVGLLPALLIALLWVVLRRSARDAVLAVLATIVGSALLCVVGRAGGPQVESGYVTMFRLGILGGIAGGALAGLCQWLLLRRWVSLVDGWIELTVAGWVIGWPLTLWGLGFPERLLSTWPSSPAAGPVEQDAPHLMLSMAAWIAAGVVVGLGQWLRLRQKVKQAGWWVLATAIGWVIAAGAGVGVMTGTMLVMLLRSAPHRSQQAVGD